MAVGPSSTAPTLGASGAIAAVLGGYIVLYPRARVLTLVLIILFFTVIELPALVMLGVWFAEQALFGASDLTNPAGGGGGVAYFAHVGGFAFGLLTVRLLATRRKQVPPPRPRVLMRSVVFAIALVFTGVLGVPDGGRLRALRGDGARRARSTDRDAVCDWHRRRAASSSPAVTVPPGRPADAAAGRRRRPRRLGIDRPGDRAGAGRAARPDGGLAASGPRS